MHSASRRVLLTALLWGAAAVVAFGAPPHATIQQTPAFGPAGTESYRATAQIQFQLGILKPQTVNLAGTLLYKRSDPGDANNNRKRDVRAQVLAMDLRGSAPDIGPVQLVVRPDRPSTGLIEARSARGDYPATAALNVFLMVRTKFGALVADQPIALAGTLPATPAVNATLTMAGRAGVTLFLLTPGGPLPVGQISRMTARTTEVVRNPPPIGGLSCFPTTATLEAEVWTSDGSVEREPIRLTGVTTIKHGDPLDRDANGLWEIPTEIVAMQLVGESARLGGRTFLLTVDPRAHLDTPGAEIRHTSLGRIDPQSPGQNFPATSFFDVFLQIHSGSGLEAQTSEKLRLEAAGGLDRFPSARPYVAPLSLDLHDLTGEAIGQTVALTLVFGDPAPCPTSMTQIARTDDLYTGAIATVELDLPESRAERLRLVGPMTIRREAGGTPGAGQPPRIGAEIVALDLGARLTDERGEQQLVRLFIDRAGNIPPAPSPGILVQLRPDSAVPARVSFGLIPEVIVGVGAAARRYRVAAPVRLGGTFQALPGTAPLCPVTEEGLQRTTTVDLLDASGAVVGSLTWGCLFPR